MDNLGCYIIKLKCYCDCTLREEDDVLSDIITKSLSWVLKPKQLGTKKEEE